MPPAIRAALAVVAVLACAPGAAAQAPGPALEPPSLFRVFLRDGTALPAVGDLAVAGDRAIFTLAVGSSSDVRMQLMSLPAGQVDLDRTSDYSRAVRAAHYAATRGEGDYEAMTKEVSTALDFLTTVKDPRERLRLAEEARRRLLEWSREHYSYRASDIAALAALFEEVIADLRAAAGESSFSFDLSSGQQAPASQALLPAPSLRESIAMALSAARAADFPEDRLAILRTALGVLEGSEAEAGLRDEVGRELRLEAAMDEAYRLMSEDLLARADKAADAGDPDAFAALRADLDSRDAALGRRRPRAAAGIGERLALAYERAVARKASLERYAAARVRIYAYEREVRPAMSGLDGLRPVLEYMRDLKFFNFRRLEVANERFDRFLGLVASIDPPEEVRDIHATLTSALHMAQQAGGRRRLAVVTGNSAFDREAAAAAAGALILADQVRQELIARMVPGRGVR
jgi:hypothetical protein